MKPHQSPPASLRPCPYRPPPSPPLHSKPSDDAMSVYLSLVNPSVRLPLSCDGQGTDSIPSWFVGSQGCDGPSLLRSTRKWDGHWLAPAKADKEIGVAYGGWVFLEVSINGCSSLPSRLDATSPEGGSEGVATLLVGVFGGPGTHATVWKPLA